MSLLNNPPWNSILVTWVLSQSVHSFFFFFWFKHLCFHSKNRVHLGAETICQVTFNIFSVEKRDMYRSSRNIPRNTLFEKSVFHEPVLPRKSCTLSIQPGTDRRASSQVILVPMQKNICRGAKDGISRVVLLRAFQHFIAGRTLLGTHECCSVTRWSGLSLFFLCTFASLIFVGDRWF